MFDCPPVFPDILDALINFPIRFGVPSVPSHICHPSGISDDNPLNIIIDPTGRDLFSPSDGVRLREDTSLLTHSVEANLEEESLGGKL